MEDFIAFRDPNLSLIQSTLDDKLTSHYGNTIASIPLRESKMGQFNLVLDALKEGDAIPAQDSKGLPIETCASLAAKLAWATARHDAATANQVKQELVMSQCDPFWAECITEYFKFKLNQGNIPYVRHNNLGDFVIELPNKNPLKIGFLGDWGTGTREAQNVAQELAALAPDILIHLGDIYYSCTPVEVQKNFLDPLRAAGIDPSTTPIFTLCGNHDMYSGGAGFYSLLAQLGQPASYFCLRNDSWQFLAMDTGLHDSNPLTVNSAVTTLEQTEIEWHLDKIANAGGRRTVLLSHHQLFSSTESIGKVNGQDSPINLNLASAFRTILAQGTIDLWLWAHEHNFLMYDTFASLQWGRCIGGSAIPVFLADEPYQQKFQGPGYPSWIQGMPCLRNDGTTYGHVFALMKLHDANASIEYYGTQADGTQATVLFTEQM